MAIVVNLYVIYTLKTAIGLDYSAKCGKFPELEIVEKNATLNLLSDRVTFAFFFFFFSFFLSTSRWMRTKKAEWRWKVTPAANSVISDVDGCSLFHSLLPPGVQFVLFLTVYHRWNRTKWLPFLDTFLSFAIRQTSSALTTTVLIKFRHSRFQVAIFSIPRIAFQTWCINVVCYNNNIFLSALDDGKKQLKSRTRIYVSRFIFRL